MPLLKSPIFSVVYQNVDSVELRDKSREHIDCYIDEEGFVIKRPGLDLVLDLGESGQAVQSLDWWPEKNAVIGVCNNKVFKIINTSGTLSATDITTNGPGTAGTPVFALAVNGNITSPTYYGVLAAGGAMVEGNGTGTTISNFTTIADADAPTAVTHVDFIDNYLIATTGKGYFGFSDISAPTTWSASSIATAMRNPDLIKALKVFNRQIFLFGNSSTEIWEHSGVPFEPNPGGFLTVGISAPYSVVPSEEGLYWLSNRRKVVMFNGNLNFISTPYDREISNFSSVSDCIGMRIEVTGKPFILFQFPTEGRTLAYSIMDKTWADWRYYNTTTGEYEHFRGKSYTYVPDWGLHLLGDRSSSKIYSLSREAKSDNGDPIRVKILTGLIDYGTSSYKRSNKLLIRMKRGEGLPSGDDPKMLIRWNDDQRGWSNTQEVSLGKLAESSPIIPIYAKGRYRTRQYEIVVTDDVGVAFGEAYEDITLLGN